MSIYIYILRCLGDRGKRTRQPAALQLAYAEIRTGYVEIRTEAKAVVVRGDQNSSGYVENRPCGGEGCGGNHKVTRLDGGQAKAVEAEAAVVTNARSCWPP